MKTQKNKKILSLISNPDDLKKLDIKQLELLSKEVREEILSVSRHKNLHLSSNLGIVEISIGSLVSFNLPNDKVFYDTGHQCYTHKILTGRKNKFHELRETDGISGFPDLDESKYDLYANGHSGSSLSVALGMLENNKDNFVVPIIGDASIANGQSFEALNNFDIKNKRLIIVLNDNGMAISKSVGAIARALQKIKLSSLFYGTEKAAKKIFSPKKDNNWFFTKLYNGYNFLEQKISGKNIFQVLGYQYVGPVDGNDMKKVLKAFDKAKWYSLQGPVVLHFKTKKGFGLDSALNDVLGEYHSYEIDSTQHTIGKTICEYLIGKTKDNKLIHVINPAMTLNSGFDSFQRLLPNNYHDVGINEEHAISFATGMSLNGLKPIVNIYSSFIQRGFDQILNDWSNLSLPITCLIDRADLSAHDGISHHGIYDVGMLKQMDNACIVSFRNSKQMKQLIDIALSQKKYSYFIRYTKNYFGLETKSNYDISEFQWEKIIEKDHDTIVVSYGPYINRIWEAMVNKDAQADLVNAIYINKYDEKWLRYLSKYKKVIVYERVKNNQLANDILNYFNEKAISSEVIAMNYQDRVEFGKLEDLDKKAKMTVNDIIAQIKK